MELDNTTNDRNFFQTLPFHNGLSLFIYSEKNFISSLFTLLTKEIVYQILRILEKIDICERRKRKFLIYDKKKQFVSIIQNNYLIPDVIVAPNPKFIQKIKQVVCSNAVAILLTIEGDCYSYRNSLVGELGLTETRDYTEIYCADLLIYIQKKNDPKIEEIFFGNGFFFALEKKSKDIRSIEKKLENNYFCWGRNEFCQFGIYIGPRHQFFPIPFEFKYRIKQIECLENLTIILTGNGNLFYTGSLSSIPTKIEIIETNNKSSLKQNSIKFKEIFSTPKALFAIVDQNKNYYDYIENTNKPEKYYLLTTEKIDLPSQDIQTIFKKDSSQFFSSQLNSDFFDQINEKIEEVYNFPTLLWNEKVIVRKNFGQMYPFFFLTFSGKVFIYKDNKFQQYLFFDINNVEVLVEKICFGSDYSWILEKQNNEQEKKNFFMFRFLDISETCYVYKKANDTNNTNNIDEVFTSYYSSFVTFVYNK